MNGAAAIQKPDRLARADWVELAANTDARGTLTAIEAGDHVPFEIRRAYLLHDLTGERGGHAHRETTQLLVAVAGSFKLDLADGQATRTFHFDDPRRGLLIAPMLFIRLYDFTPDARALILASTHYNPAKTIRSWDAYLAELRG